MKCRSILSCCYNSRAQEDLLDHPGLMGSAEDRDHPVPEVHLDPGELLENLEDQVRKSNAWTLTAQIFANY